MSDDGFLPQLAAIRQDANTCDRCPLRKHSKQPVIFRGSPHPKILFIGEAPGQQEDERGLPFVGPAGKELETKIAETGMATDDWAVINTVLHRPINNRYDLSYGVACRPYVDRLLTMLSPSKVVLLGRNAEELYRDRLRLPVRAILHPAAVFYSGENRTRWDSQWQALGPWLQEE